ncbi:hypothetical protein MUP77_01240 [Candidatus Bathyarchaeota archaeon]|nr:hypothetical protein [Candidatus Bathyarchaeota archaeon]
MEKRCDRQIRVRLGYQGGNVDCIINWSEDLGLWFHSRKLEGTFNFERIAISRYWNAFGLSEVVPRQDSMLPIVCEINPPLEGLDKRTQGVFARDDGRIWLLYRGKIGGGRPGIGRRLFFENYLGEVEDIAGERFAIVGDICSSDFVECIRNLVREVERIKGLTHEGVNPSGIGMTSAPRKEIRPNGERAGPTDKQKRFAEFVEDLKNKGIRGPDYRKRVEEWGRENH